MTFEDLRSGRVRLEFGNSEQLRVIREYEARQDRAVTECAVCQGAGEITCPCCDGTGKKVTKKGE